jgi:pyruvate-formate lyase-activating enzyme
MWLSIRIKNNKKGRELAKFLRTIEYVESVDVEDPTIPLKEEDWSKPGRPATDEEIEQLASEIENEEGGVEAGEFFSELKNYKVHSLSQ